jgi:hypothetical protein
MLIKFKVKVTIETEIFQFKISFISAAVFTNQKYILPEKILNYKR